MDPCVLRNQEGSMRFGTFKEALKAAARKGGRLISNRAVEFLRFKGKSGLPDKPFFTRTLAAHPAKGEKIGPQITCTCDGERYVLETSTFQGLQNVVLLIDNYDIRREGDTHFIKPKGDITIIYNFPQSADEGQVFSILHGVPVMGGDIVDSEKKASLTRRDEETIAPVVRAGNGSSHAIMLAHGMGGEFGIMLEGAIA